ncbi:MAG: hypothetical protein QOF53_1863 [Nocardioidaceae bacterium]|nr:hypothetical protein [Nocardioidaceae bacterium]
MSTNTDREESRTLVVRGQQVRVVVRPPRGHFADAPPLLLCNGIGASLEVLQPLVDALHPDRGVVRFDVPGVGGSPLPRAPYTMAVLASWLGALVTELDFGRFDVLGLSWGGGVAQQLAFHCPRRVRNVVLVATGTGCLMVPARPEILGKMMTPRRHRDPAYAARVAGELYGGSMRSDPERGRALLHQARPVGPKRGYYYQLAAGFGWSSLPGLPFLRQPTLVLAGDDDPIIPVVNAHLMARMIPRSQLHIYHGGHLAVLTESDELVPVVERFLRG